MKTIEVSWLTLSCRRRFLMLETVFEVSLIVELDQSNLSLHQGPYSWHQYIRPRSRRENSHLLLPSPRLIRTALHSIQWLRETCPRLSRQRPPFSMLYLYPYITVYKYQYKYTSRAKTAAAGRTEDSYAQPQMTNSLDTSLNIYNAFKSCAYSSSSRSINREGRTPAKPNQISSSNARIFNALAPSQHAAHFMHCCD